MLLEDVEYFLEKTKAKECFDMLDLDRDGKISLQVDPCCMLRYDLCCMLRYNLCCMLCCDLCCMLCCDLCCSYLLEVHSQPACRIYTLAQDSKISLEVLLAACCATACAVHIYFGPQLACLLHILDLVSDAKSASRQFLLLAA